MSLTSSDVERSDDGDSALLRLLGQQHRRRAAIRFGDIQNLVALDVTYAERRRSLRSRARSFARRSSSSTTSQSALAWWATASSRSTCEALSSKLGVARKCPIGNRGARRIVCRLAVVGARSAAAADPRCRFRALDHGDHVFRRRAFRGRLGGHHTWIEPRLSLWGLTQRAVPSTFASEA